MPENTLVNKSSKNTKMSLEKFNGIMLIFIILVIYIFGNNIILKLYYAPQLLASLTMILLWWAPKTLRQKHKIPLVIASGIVLFHSVFNIYGPLPIGAYFYISNWLFIVPTLAFFSLKSIPYILNNPLVNYGSAPSPLGYLAFALVQFLYVYLLTTLFYYLYKKIKA